MADDQVRVRVLVSGMVQGVFFRATTRDTARNLGLTGAVRNLADRRVEVEAQGQRAAVERLITFLREGPDQAEVTDVDVEHLEPVGGERGFRVS